MELNGETLMVVIPIALVLLVAIFYLGWFINSKIGKNSIQSANEQRERILDDAEKEAKNIKREKLLEVKDEWYRKKQEFDKEVNTKKQKLQNQEKQLATREESIEKKFEVVVEKEKENKAFEKKFTEREKVLDEKNEELDKLIIEQNIRLEKTAALTAEEAKKMLMENMTEQAKMDAAQAIKDIRDQAKVEAKKESQKIIVQAIQRTAVDHSVETTVSVVQIQNDEMKGRIIGREGRNIRAFISSF